MKGIYQRGKSQLAGPGRQASSEDKQSAKKESKGGSEERAEGRVGEREGRWGSEKGEGRVGAQQGTKQEEAGETEWLLEEHSIQELLNFGKHFSSREKRTCLKEAQQTGRRAR